jgi:hypothetical protein
MSVPSPVACQVENPAAPASGSGSRPLPQQFADSPVNIHRNLCGKVALTAIMRKLLILANALLRDGRTWSPSLA